MLHLLLSAAFAAPVLTVGGACPGIISLEVTNATASSQVAIVSADGPGTHVLASGCPATETGLDSAGFALRGLPSADGGGNISITPTLTAGVCGAWVQAIDATTCETSNVVQMSAVTCPEFVPQPSLAIGETGNLVGTTAATNEWRERVGSARLWWNATLAASAQAYADTCPLTHDPARSPDAGYSYVGENLSFFWPSGDGPDSVAGWVSERELYDYGTTVEYANVNDFGHYTETVWDGTESMGCGWSDCIATSGWITVVCRYGQGGNMIGQTPYDYTVGSCLDLDNDDFVQSIDADDTNRAVQ